MQKALATATENNSRKDTDLFGEAFYWRYPYSRIDTVPDNPALHLLLLRLQSPYLKWCSQDLSLLL